MRHANLPVYLLIVICISRSLDAVYAARSSRLKLADPTDRTRRSQPVLSSPHAKRQINTNPNGSTFLWLLEDEYSGQTFFEWVDRLLVAWLNMDMALPVDSTFTLDQIQLSTSLPWFLDSIKWSYHLLSGTVTYGIHATMRSCSKTLWKLVMSMTVWHFHRDLLMSLKMALSSWKEMILRILVMANIETGEHSLD